ncbi:MAG: hypothetical protein PVH79_01450 [Candidatus Bathyarchaeota archaeon]|jgi:hypothetical protein
MEIESREILHPQQLLESEIEIDLAEFDYYCNLFEKMLSRLEREEGHETYGAQPFTTNSWGFMDSCVYLDEFDIYEIDRMRHKF